MHPDLARHIPSCEAIATLFAPNAEAVLHDLNSERIAFIANPFSKRRVGDDSLLEIDEKKAAGNRERQIIGPYRKVNWDGRNLKSISAILRDTQGKAIGLLCINYDIHTLDALVNQLGDLIAIPEANNQQATSLLGEDWRETVNALIQQFLTAQHLSIQNLQPLEHLVLIAELDKEGLFAIRKATPYIAKVLGLSRATFYKRLKEYRSQAKLTGITDA